MTTSLHRSGLALAVASGLLVAAGCAGSNQPTDDVPPEQPASTPLRVGPHSPGGTIVLPRSTAPRGTGLDGTTIPSPDPATTTRATGADGSRPPSPSIVTFTVPTPVFCAGPLATVPASYEITGADRVVFLVDGEQQPEEAPAPSGTFSLHVPCDGRVHVVILTAVSPEDQPTLESRTVFTQQSARGG